MVNCANCGKKVVHAVKKAGKTFCCTKCANDYTKGKKAENVCRFC